VSRAIATLALVVVWAASSRAAHADGTACQATPAVSTARAALTASRESLAARFGLADALAEAKCFHDAVHTLEEGLALHPRSTELQTRLRNARSLVSEQEFFAGKDEAELAARVSRNLLRCNRLAELAACEEALKLKPNDADIHLAQGDALLKAERPGEAEAAYRRATEIRPGDARAMAQLTLARSQRKSLLIRCLERSDDLALAACQGALSPGSEEEFQVHARLATLHQQRNQSAAALGAYIAAQALKPEDRGIALGIVALADATPRKDAVALEALGSALLTLKRGREAVDAFRQAQALSPALPSLRAQIARAEKLAAAEPMAALTPASPATPAQSPLVARTYSNAAEPSRSR
jgi:tetratricopeptide (TPR) repeat protein